ncbi:Alpha-D-glucose-1-phosphate phosphatase YihX [Mycena venus]|uniref:Alpha-D-glucose-1-phosphate phosphatase YihX n=1 Tax=Mycena venus TaxID=2733690 RepID=A0A8H6YF70_9AGAR|nr:Alpha-D-glucose-1-phosphate phosphatase YihX [Mycena venus]
MSWANNFDSLILDIGDVLFTWSPDTKTTISPKRLKQILTCSIWLEYEKGLISEADCYDRAGVEFSLPHEEIRHALVQARESLQSDQELIGLIRELKERSNGALRQKVDWDLFERIFTSSEVGERKPHLGFYNYVLREAKIDPRRAIFIDDKLDNVLSARSLGLYGIVFPSDGSNTIRRILQNLLNDPVLRARDYLRHNAGRLQSITHTGVVVQENFAQLMILQATDDRDLVNIVDFPGAWNFFHESTAPFPCDLDTTSLALTVMDHDEQVAKSVMDEMLQYVDSDGIILTYFDHKRPRMDPVVCVNVLHLFYKFHRESEVQATLKWVFGVLQNRDGTRYYETAEFFLYFLVRLLLSAHDAELHDALGPLLRERLSERIGIAGDALQLAMRIVACSAVGLPDDVDRRMLLMLQCEDGGFEIGWMYKIPSSGDKIGNRGLATALAIQALESAERPAVTWTSSATASEPVALRRRFSPPALRWCRGLVNAIRRVLPQTSITRVRRRV